MKTLIIIFFLCPFFCFAQGKHTLTPFTNSFALDGRMFPLNTTVMNIRPDSVHVEIDYANGAYPTNQVIIFATADTNYINGITGLNFANVDSLSVFYQKYMVK